MDDRHGRAIIAVDLLRFACAMLVVFYHFGAGDWITPSDHARVVLAGVAPPASSAVARVGWIGVELFFVISGLVIARSAAGVDAATFIRRRALRLLPAAWICASLTAAMFVANGQGDGALAAAWARSIAFFPVGPQVDGSYWTLGIEVVFYLTVAALGRGEAARIERIAFVLGVASGTFWLASLLAPNLTALGNDRLAMLVLLPHGCLFALGITIAALAERVTVRRLAALVAWTAASLVEIATHAAERVEHGVAASAPLAIAIFLVGLAVLLSGGWLQAVLARWVAPGAARVIGIMTYPLYLLHQDAGAVLMAVAVGAGLVTEAAAVTAAMMVVATAWLVAGRIEPPLRARLAAVLNRFHGPAPDSRRSASPRAG